MISSKECNVGNHNLCSDKSYECGCHSNLIRPLSDKIEDGSYMQGIPVPE